MKSIVRKCYRVPSKLIGSLYYLIKLLYVHNLPKSHPKFGPHFKQALLAIMKVSRKRGARKNYTIGTILGALQAKNCGCEKITLTEFGVATGGGFRALMLVANAIRDELNMDVRVVGFDNRTGLPEPKDYRDHPEIWKVSQFAMASNYESIDADAQKNGSELIIGDIAETIRKFDIEDSVLAFASIDVDYYSSTKPITEWLGSLHSNHLLPATVLYFDDVLYNWTYSQGTGEALAIEEFNEQSNERRIELKHRNLRLYALHDFNNPFRQGVKAPTVQLELFVKDLERFYVFD